MSEKTIAAISTPYGRGGVALIRISGEDALGVAQKAFRPLSGKSIYDIPHGQCVYGKIYHGNEAVDDGMCTVFRAPRSYTGEDTVEISCHGGILITSKVLEAVYLAGASPAGPGEFTKRAFISGKLDLTKAEAVIASINAESEEQLKLARSHMEGGLSKKIRTLSLGLVKILARCYVLCDYPDEDLAEVSNDEVEEILLNIKNELETLIKGYKVGHAVAEGIKTAIVGRPNVGKSSLLNGLLGYKRAIVTDIPGTTRDTVEEKLYVGKVLLRLCDTAGIRSSEGIDEVERLGIERSMEALENSELVFAVFDISESLTKEDRDILAILKDNPGVKVAVLNKCDKSAVPEIEEEIGNAGFNRTIKISAKEQVGFDELRELVEGLYFEGEIDYSKKPTLSLARQKVSVEKSLEYIKRALDGIRSGLPADIAGLDIEGAIACLDEVDGRKISEGIVGEIFSRFCVGK